MLFLNQDGVDSTMLCRFVFVQSETCSILIPELEFELGMAAVGGKFTTLEGLLKDIKDLVSTLLRSRGGMKGRCSRKGAHRD